MFVDQGTANFAVADYAATQSADVHVSMCHYMLTKFYVVSLSRLKYDGVFELIHKHNLLDSIHDKIVMLMDFNKGVMMYFLYSNIKLNLF